MFIMMAMECIGAIRDKDPSGISAQCLGTLAGDQSLGQISGTHPS